MSLFTNHLGLILYEDHDGRPVLRGAATQWFVNPPLTYVVDTEDGGDRITVPAFNPVGKSELEIVVALAAGKAFVTDLGSIPQVAWSLGFSPSGPEAKAFVVHDYLYVRRGMGCGHRYVANGRVDPVSYDRAQADRILLDAMLRLGCNHAKSRIIYDAVRLGGEGAWGT